MGEGQRTDYVVLARKYRPRSFAELYGQDALVRTLSNAIEAGKIHHAYVLTGIRGVGKTTTARIMAKALNCENGPSVAWDEADPQVQAITTGTHVDVLEYDAASNRSVEDIARLFEGVAYAPSVGRYKVYIIDEVHMLSTTAFNALLKTLEEPPPRVKFIFATTEVNKIPVTVLSRCQRFDLKRIPSETLVALFTDILGKEKLEAEPAAVAMVARAADGSARDGLSLLDQAIALSHGKPVGAALVQEMLGLADRAQLYDLLEKVLTGDVPGALSILDGLYARGQDALGAVQGLLEVVHLLTRLKIVPGLKDDRILTEIEKTRAVPLAEKMGLPNVSRLYQVLSQAAQDVKQAERPYEAFSMALVRAAYLAPLPGLDKLLVEAQAAAEKPTAQVASAGAMGVQAMPVAPAPVAMPPQREVPPWEEEPAVQAAPAPKALPTDWSGLVAQVRSVKPALAAALGQQVRCVDLVGGEAPSLTLQVDRGLHEAKDLLRDLRMALKDIGGVAWQITQADGADAPTLREQGEAKAAAQKQIAAEDPGLRDALAMFPGAEIEDIQLSDNG